MKLFINRLIFIFIFLLAVSALAYFFLGNPSPGIDDAKIYLVYGRNIINGFGGVYNPGGEKVEGFASILWLSFATVGTYFFSNPIYFLLICSFLFQTIIISLFWSIIDRDDFISWKGFLYLGWIFSNVNYILWNTFALTELSLWTLVLGVCIYIVMESESTIALTFMIPILLLTRPEGMLWGIIFIIGFGISGALDYGISRATNKIKFPVIAFIITIVCLLFFRVSYFGYPFPGIYYSKLSFDRIYNLQEGFKYLKDFIRYSKIQWIIQFAILQSAILGIPVIWGIIKDYRPGEIYKERLKKLLLSAFVISGLIIPILAGEDYIGQFKFYQIIWLFMGFLFVIFIGGLVEIISPGDLNEGLKFLCVLIFIPFLIFIPRGNWSEIEDYRKKGNFLLSMEFFNSENNQKTSLALNEMFSAEPPSIGVINAGGSALYYKGYIYDLSGVINLEMNHSYAKGKGYKNYSTFDLNVFFKQKPDILLPAVYNSRQEVDFKKIWNPSDFKSLKGVFGHTRFWKLYTPAIVSDGKHWIVGYYRKDILKNILERKLQIDFLGLRETGINSEYELIAGDPANYISDLEKFLSYKITNNTKIVYLFPPELESELKKDDIAFYTKVLKIPLPIHSKNIESNLTSIVKENSKFGVLIFNKKALDPDDIINSKLKEDFKEDLHKEFNIFEYYEYVNNYPDLE